MTWPSSSKKSWQVSDQPIWKYSPTVKQTVSGELKLIGGSRGKSAPPPLLLFTTILFLFIRLVISQDFNFFVTNLPLSTNFLGRREVATKERKNRSSLYLVQTSSFLFVWMWRVCKSSKIKHPGGSGGFVLQTKGRPRPSTHFQDYLLLSNHSFDFFSFFFFWWDSACCSIKKEPRSLCLHSCIICM